MDVIPDSKISALPAATLPLVGDEAVAVVQSGATRQAPGSAFAANSVFVCTSTTRPSSPFRGQVIYESDTGLSMQWQSSTTGWTPPWSTAWGELQYTPATSSPGDVSAEQTILAFGSVVLPSNRLIDIEFRAPSVQGLNLVVPPGDWANVMDTSSTAFGLGAHNANLAAPPGEGWLKLWVADSSNTHLGLLCRQYLTDGADRTIALSLRKRLAGLSGTFAPKIRGLCNASGGAIRFNVNGGTDPGPIEGRIIDAGPAGPPA